eukprot:jgi/Botrbrau1/13733/Bobra.0356s0011.2
MQTKVQCSAVVSKEVLAQDIRGWGFICWVKTLRMLQLRPASPTEIAERISSPNSLDRVALQRQEHQLEMWQEHYGFQKQHGDGIVNEGPTLIGSIFRQQVAEYDGKSQLFSPRIYVRSEPETHKSMRHDLSYDPGPPSSLRMYPSETPISQPSLGLANEPPDDQSNFSLPRFELQRLDTETQLSCQSLASPTEWRDNLAFCDADGDLGVEMEAQAGSQNLWSCLSTMRRPHAHSDPLGAEAEAPLHRTVSWIVCVTFEEILPHPSRGLLSRMLRLTDVRSTPFEDSPEPLLHLRPSTDYLLTCSVRPCLPNVPLPEALRLWVGITGHETAVDMERGRTDDAKVWLGSGCWRSPEMPLLADTNNMRQARLRGRLTITSLLDCGASKHTLQGGTQWNFQAHFSRDASDLPHDTRINAATAHEALYWTSFGGAIPSTAHLWAQITPQLVSNTHMHGMDSTCQARSFTV